MLIRVLRPPLALLLLAGLAACGTGGDTADRATDDSTSSPAATQSSPSGPTTTCDYPPAGTPAREVTPPPSEAPAAGSVTATIETSAGDLDATLHVKSAPCTVNSFVSLAQQGYFDDSTCHRLTTQGILVLQCGDPSGTGAGGPGYSFGDELSGEEKYPAGTLAMANGGPDTNGSQFFVVYGNTRLPPLYTVFGRVDGDSVAVVEKVAQEGSDNINGPGDGAPNTPVTIESVTLG